MPPMEPAAVQTEGAWWGRHLHELRWQAELARLVVDPVFHGRGVPRGDGRPVLLIPGFLAGDGSLSVMAGWLDRIGYRAHASGILLNVDCSDRALKRLEARVERCAERAEAKVAVIGHSRGGHFAKALAHRRPDLVCSVVSMGAGSTTRSTSRGSPTVHSRSCAPSTRARRTAARATAASP